MAGMTTAALVSGNTVVLKPASPTAVIAAKFVELLEEAGVPAGVVNFLPDPEEKSATFSSPSPDPVHQLHGSPRRPAHQRARGQNGSG